MKYLVSFSKVQVVGKLWMPNCPAAMDKTIEDSAIKEMIGDDGLVSRDEIDNWLSTHCGDFSSITDFRADIELPNGQNQLIEWANEESEFLYNDCMFPEEL